jgi:hypothetical protein
MKYLLMILAVVMIFAAPALAADQGNLSQNAMAKMGLSGISVMSDVQGTSIRGMGFSKAWGSSWAGVKGAGSDNAYFAVDKGKKGSLAGGLNLSIAGKGTLNAGLAAGDIALGSRIVFAGGGSIAFTK